MRSIQGHAGFLPSTVGEAAALRATLTLAARSLNEANEATPALADFCDSQRPFKLKGGYDMVPIGWVGVPLLVCKTRVAIGSCLESSHLFVPVKASPLKN